MKLIGQRREFEPRVDRSPASIRRVLINDKEGRGVVVDIGQARRELEDSHSSQGRELEPVAHIYRPARSVMQSGRANAKGWILEFEPQSPPFIEPLMGWTASDETLRQIRLKFPTRHQAIDFVRRQGWSYSVSEPNEFAVRPKMYAENFLWRPGRH